MESEEKKNCVSTKIHLCGEAHNVVIDYQAAYQKRTGRKISKDLAINVLLKEKK